MTTRLLLALGEHWPDSPACRWAHLSSDNNLLEAGHSGPEGWPAATTCEALLCGPQVLWLECTLPALGRSKRRELPRLLAFALEDRLLCDPGTQHLTTTHRLPDDQNTREFVGVLIIDKDRLRTILGTLEGLSRRPARIVAELQTAPAELGEWHLSLASHGATLRTSHQSGLAIDLEDIAPTLSRQYAQAGPARPDLIALHLEPDYLLPDGIVPGDNSNPPLVSASPYLWWQSMTSASDNLLHSEFGGSKSRNGQQASFRIPLLIAVAAVILGVLVDSGEVLWLRHQHSELVSRINGIYQSTFPGDPVVTPPARMRQQLSLEREPHGLLRHDDGLALLTGLAEVLGSDYHDGIVAMHFEDGVLDLTLSGTLLPRINEIIAALATRGLLGTIRDNVDPPHLLVRPEVF
ncbi:MAG: type II secretion system protein GspL [Azonexus sp.]|nr:type II secretion system protein GspL [Azonexus sp.]